MTQTPEFSGKATTTLSGTAVENEFLEGLFEHEFLVPTGVSGVYGRCAKFELLVSSFDRLIEQQSLTDGAVQFRFPPTIPRADFERSEYLKSFPHLAGSIFSFEGDAAAHSKLVGTIDQKEDWSASQRMTAVVLTPAACYPLYPMAARTGPIAGSRLFDVYSWCFRHEPSPDPARMQMFRMREFVRMGEGPLVDNWRRDWVTRGTELFASLGLSSASEPANDPFFGRRGKMLGANQRDQGLKYELQVPICSEEKPTALMSVNYHQDHFGTKFGVSLTGNRTAHTACVGFGYERIVLALIRHHGFSLDRWPNTVRERLGLP